MIFMLTISGAVSAALLPSTHHATWSPAVSACSPSTGLSTFSIHHARTAMLSMVETTSAPPDSTTTVPVRAITRWTARAVVLVAVTTTPMFQWVAADLAMEWSRVVAPVVARLPTVSMPPVVARLLQVAAAATRARLLVLSAMFALHIAPLLPAAALPAAVPVILSNPLALHIGRASASAGAAAVLVCAALPPADTAPVTDSSVLAIDEAEEVEEVLPKVPLPPEAVSCSPLPRPATPRPAPPRLASPCPAPLRQLAPRSAAPRLACGSRHGARQR
jgi:hypothetical protein